MPVKIASNITYVNLLPSWESKAAHPQLISTCLPTWLLDDYCSNSPLSQTTTSPFLYTSQAVPPDPLPFPQVPSASDQLIPHQLAHPPTPSFSKTSIKAYVFFFTFYAQSNSTPLTSIQQVSTLHFIFLIATNLPTYQSVQSAHPGYVFWLVLCLDLKIIYFGQGRVLWLGCFTLILIQNDLLPGRKRLRLCLFLRFSTLGPSTLPLCLFSWAQRYLQSLVSFFCYSSTPD